MDVRVAKTSRSANTEYCERCQRAVSFDEKARHQGMCVSCSTEAETSTFVLDEPPTSIH